MTVDAIWGRFPRTAACALALAVAASISVSGAAVAKQAAKPAPVDSETSQATDSEAAAKAQRCNQLTAEVKKQISIVKALEIRAEREKVGPPATLKRAWERMSGMAETGNTVTSDQLAAARNRVTMLSTGLVANSCPPVDPASVKPADLQR